MRTTRFGSAIGGALLIIAGAGCGAGQDSVPAGPWQLAEGTTSEGSIPLDDRWPVTLRFENGRVEGTAACNHYSYEFRIAAGIVQSGAGGSTAMACEPEDFDVLATESGYLEALREVDGVDQSAERLTFTGPDIELIFRPLAEPPIADLVDRTWVLDSLVGMEDGTSVPVNPSAELEITEDTLHADTGCGAFSGSWIPRGEQILVNYSGSETEADCTEEADAQHGHLVGVLGDGFRPELDGDRLSLISRGGEAAVYREAG